MINGTKTRTADEWRADRQAGTTLSDPKKKPDFVSECARWKTIYLLLRRRQLEHTKANSSVWTFVVRIVSQSSFNSNAIQTRSAGATSKVTAMPL